MERHFTVLLVTDKHLGPIRAQVLEETPDGLDLTQIGQVEYAPFDTLQEALLHILRLLVRGGAPRGLQGRLPSS